LPDLTGFAVSSGLTALEENRPNPHHKQSESNHQTQPQKSQEKQGHRQLQNRLYPLPVVRLAHSVHHGVEFQVFLSSQLGIQRGFLKDNSDIAVNLILLGPDIKTRHQCFSLGSMQQCRQDTYG
jgi:hypothetical protein